MTDEGSLLQRAKAYDPEALAELYDRYAPRMYAYIYRRVGDAALAEDLSSELFLRVVRSIRTERAWSTSFGAWLYRIAHNLVANWHRDRSRRLTPEQQEVLTLRFGEGLTAAETAQIMNKSTGAVEALQHRAVASLRRILAGDEL